MYINIYIPGPSTVTMRLILRAEPTAAELPLAHSFVPIESWRHVLAPSLGPCKPALLDFLSFESFSKFSSFFLCLPVIVCAFNGVYTGHLQKGTFHRQCFANKCPPHTPPSLDTPHTLRTHKHHAPPPHTSRTHAYQLTQIDLVLEHFAVKISALYKKHGAAWDHQTCVMW